MIGRIDRTNFLQSGDRRVPVVLSSGGGCLIRPSSQITLSLRGREQGGGLAVAGLLLLDRGEQINCLLPFFLVEVVDCLRIPVGEFGVAELGLCVGDDPTRVRVARVKPRQLLSGSDDGLPSPGLMQRGHVVDQCLTSLCVLCLF